MHVPGYDPRSDETGNVLIPFAYTGGDIPFPRWQMVSTKVFQADGPVVIQSIIVTHRGEVFVQYAKEINDEKEYQEEFKMNLRSAYPPEATGESLVTRDEKRSYE